MTNEEMIFIWAMKIIDHPCNLPAVRAACLAAVRDQTAKNLWEDAIQAANSAIFGKNEEKTPQNVP